MAWDKVGLSAKAAPTSVSTAGSPSARHHSAVPAMLARPCDAGASDHTFGDFICGGT
ncbi:hypothetical protein L665_00178 [Ralstonia solanacearum SD54]|nr:hypothetical protein A3768_5643 [Ralstonia solanacearum]ESS51914.1 hypothetical protein L665_00178 [Ralstonia solanacearum SD54]